MPRSRVLHAPSQECGDGLHIGTFAYASTFYGGDTVMLVKFSPRDIVSLPDSNSAWKLRVCRFTVIGPVDEALDTPLYITKAIVADYIDATEDAAAGIQDSVDLGFSPTEGDLTVGTRVVDLDGDVATVVAEADEDNDVEVEYDDDEYGTDYVDADDLVVATDDQSESSRRIHGKGGPTSYAAKGRGRNPAQDGKGRFSSGRPGSQRNTLGRFSG
jgi:hypothetical protein